MHNPFKGWKVTGNWLDHVGIPAYPAKGSTGYSAGGTDYPLPYGTALPAPASGTLRISGGTGEFAAGQIGSAGRRSILMLDEPIRDLVAIVFQHQSKFGESKHYDEGAHLGLSGASAYGKDFGGDIHLHIHGLDKRGNRLDFTLYVVDSTAAGVTAQPLVTIAIPTEIGTLMKPIIIFGPTTGAKFPYLYDPYTGERHFLQPVELSAIRESKQGITEMTLGTQAEFDAIQKRPGTR